MENSEQKNNDVEDFVQYRFEITDATDLRVLTFQKSEKKRLGRKPTKRQCIKDLIKAGLTSKGF